MGLILTQSRDRGVGSDEYWDAFKAFEHTAFEIFTSDIFIGLVWMPLVASIILAAAIAVRNHLEGETISGEEKFKSNDLPSILAAELTALGAGHLTGRSRRQAIAALNMKSDRKKRQAIAEIVAAAAASEFF